MKAYVTYTILDTIEMDFNGTPEEFKESVLFDASNVAAEIEENVGLSVSDIEIELRDVFY